LGKSVSANRHALANFHVHLSSCPQASSTTKDITTTQQVIYM
jgi:hypothetical protein